jgi:hypothetical protein
MKLPSLLRTALCLTIASSIFATADAQVVNGGFETGNLSGWTVTDPSGFTAIGTLQPLAHSGDFYAQLGAAPNPGSLLQNLSTTPGQLYQLSFWLASDRTGTVSNSFEVFWNGVSILMLTNVPAPQTINPYVNFTLNNLPAAASGNSTALEFRYVNNDDFFRLDDVSANVVPEASTMTFALLGLGLLCFGRRGLRAFQRICLTR